MHVATRPVTARWEVGGRGEEQTFSVSAETFMEDLRAVMVLPHFRFRGGLATAGAAVVGGLPFFSSV